MFKCLALEESTVHTHSNNEKTGKWKSYNFFLKKSELKLQRNQLAQNLNKDWVPAERY